MTQQQQNSDLALNISRFCNCIAVVGAFYLAPQIVKLIRTGMYDYLSNEFGSELAHYGSWVFVGTVVLAVYFGVSMVIQLVINAVMRAASRKAWF